MIIELYSDIIRATNGGASGGKRLKSTELPRYLSCQVIQKESFNFDRLFNLIIDNRWLFNEIFYMSSNGNLDTLIAEFENVSDGDKSTLKALQLYPRVTQTDETQIKHELHFNGIDDSDQEVALDFLSLTELKGLPFYLYSSHDVNIVTLFELIHRVLFELSFWGHPMQRDRAKEQLKKETAEAHKEIETGEVEAVDSLKVLDTLEGIIEERENEIEKDKQRSTVKIEDVNSMSLELKNPVNANVDYDKGADVFKLTLHVLNNKKVHGKGSTLDDAKADLKQALVETAIADQHVRGMFKMTTPE